MATTNSILALIGYYLPGGILIGWTTISGLQASNVAGSTKKITVACVGPIVYTIGNIISSQTFQAKDAPKYLPAKISIVILYLLIMIDFLVMRWVFVQRSKLRDQARSELGEACKVGENHESLDQTDLENRELRYALWHAISSTDPRVLLVRVLLYCINILSASGPIDDATTGCKLKAKRLRRWYVKSS
ncbi:hypothetical protein CLAFUW4_10868 [Fulvia fulva]|uniref:Uncharacterized protein n=1 Tax=Passalora fulva TaxID=5499 RepID=A0A9Q8URC3_PASFU|nr:uncharacterized protein CLAFUR5_09910 [Fulvia fulva]KAK4619821.1 hypothetical protein CLAFUR4_10873 [Fulvia fulva]KAK4620595.1 hypothetical protein CLAFUR0_10880 [Fulvia fulva]UJO19571.1 hypothetical protein CLAFUR5_09910 [Fulvia fulva]WPV16830.1 hypothetical protein CLAFUW4_10868 [Fulvia fulva]WPV32259.1 hypothetical protein CLAFUW7_10866 [Fulvia fulva]